MQLQEYCELVVDCEHKTAPTQAEGYPSIRTPNIGRGRFLLDGVNRVSTETYRAWTKRAIPLPGDLVMAREAPVGNVALVPEGLQPCLGQRTLLIRPNRDMVDPTYLTYLLLGPQVQGTIHARTNGATVAHLNMKDVRELELPVIPPLPIQRRIAGILAAYDGLIENCERRIRVLDEMARALYREWFVLFRYPGHEKTPFVDSPLGRIPKGWRVAPLDELKASQRNAINGGPFGSKLGTKDYVPHGVPVIRGSNLGEDGRFRAEEFVFVSPEKARELATNIARPGDIVITQRGTLGQAGRIPVGIGYDEFVISQSQMKVTLSDVEVDLDYAFFLLRSEETAQRLKSLAFSSGVPHINLAILRELSVLVPDRALQGRFGNFAKGTEPTIEHLLLQRDTLRRTRELLLPRLVSGQLSVEDAA